MVWDLQGVNMTKLDDFNKIIHNGHEINKVLHQGKIIWTKEPDVYLAKDSDFVKVDKYWVYRGTELEIKIPHVIQGESITSYAEMFDGGSPYNATPVTRVVSDNPNVTSMSSMFYYSKATTLDLSSFNTSNVTSMGYMFNNSRATTLDLSSFDTSNVTSTVYMFYNSKAKVGYARTQADADKFNESSGKPAGLKFVVKP